MHRASLLIIVIGVFFSVFAYAEDEIETNDDGGSTKPGMVLVEPTHIVATSVEGEYRLESYRERRKRWGGTVGIAYSTYEPINYEPDFVARDFSDVYTSPEMPMIELSVSVKRNFSFGSLGGEVGVGVYTNESDNLQLGDSTLTLIPVRAGAVFYLDMISAEPTFVPYIAGGVYTMVFKETLEGVSKNGNTQAAPYFNGGIAFQLDWIDRQAARVAYEDSGIESSFFFLEVRKQMASANAADKDFSNDVSFAAGLRSEF